MELVATEESGSGLTNNFFDEEIKDNDDEIARSFIQQGAEIRMETSLSNIDSELRSLQNLSSTIIGKIDLLSQVQPIWATMVISVIFKILFRFLLKYFIMCSAKDVGKAERVVKYSARVTKESGYERGWYFKYSISRAT